MKFNEKLIELRKQKGLSQEELGYKLNVTRQTVSKWELGQTTPEMDKLVEMSKLFNISLDQLLNENVSETQSNITEHVDNTTTGDTINDKNGNANNTNNKSDTIEDQPIGNKTKRERSIITIIAIVLVIVIIMIIIKICMGFSLFGSIFKQATDMQKSVFDGIKDSANKMEDYADKMTDNAVGEINNINEQIGIAGKEFNKDSFNDQLGISNGTNVGTTVKKAFDNIITINKTKDKKITVKYNEIETQDPEQIKNSKKDITNTDNYEVSFDYDTDGYINKVTIEKLAKEISKFDISRFNGSFEIFAGSRMGGSVTSVLDNVITSNKTNDRKISVKYNEMDTQEEANIRSIKQQIDTFKNYDISFDYDSDGFINKVTITNL